MNSWDDWAAQTTVLPEPDKKLAGSIFVEEPVPLDVFIRDARYLSNPDLSWEQFEAVRHIERIYLPDTYHMLARSADKDIRDYWSMPCDMKNLITLMWGKGSGKDHICRISVLRVAYLLLCLDSPQRYFGLPEQDSIHCLNVASSSKQASRAFFTPMRRAVVRPGSWFQTMGVEIVEGAKTGPKATRRSLERRRREMGHEPAQALLDTIRFAKNVEAVSGHSDADSQEGLNLIIGIMDEVDAFRSKAELEKAGGNRLRESSSSVEAVLEMLQTSASTRFPKTYKNVRISYPRYLGSPIMKLTDDARKDVAESPGKSRHYVSGPKCTWDVNPRITGKDDFADDYKKDPAMAAAKYECRPSRAVNPYFANEQALKACQTLGPNPVQVDYARNLEAWKPVYTFDSGFHPIQGALYAMHADLARTGDRAGVTLAHVQDWEEVVLTGYDEEGKEVPVSESRPVVKVDFMLAYEASKEVSPPREIQIRWARELCHELRRRGFPVLRFTFDQFQSDDSIQILQTWGVDTDRFSMDRDETGWRTLRDVAYEGRLRLPSPRPKSEAEEKGDHGPLDTAVLVINELLGLTRLPNGKIDHPADGSKDVADSLGGAVAAALAVGGREDPGGARNFPGGQHVFGGQPSKAMHPIGMPPLSYLIEDEPTPDFVKDEADYFPSFIDGLGYVSDFGEVPARMLLWKMKSLASPS